MSSSSYNTFQPRPPLRTGTNSSEKSHSSGTTSPDMHYPTSTSFYPRSPTSPAEDSFFGALSAKIRGRSRSRSRARAASPEHATTASASSRSAAHQDPSSRPAKARHVSSASQGSIASTASGLKGRPGMPADRRSTSSSSDLWRGRHSNSWLFNDFSFTETASKAFKRGS